MQCDALVASACANAKALGLKPKSTRNNFSPPTIPIFQSYNLSLTQDSQFMIKFYELFYFIS